MNNEAQLIEILRANDRVMRLLRAVRALDLEQWCIAAGTVRNVVWDHLHGYTEPTMPRDVDVLMFDPARTDPSYERNLEELLAASVPEVSWEVVNQATIHSYTGDPEPYQSIEAAMSRWADLVTAVGARLESDDEISIVAPCGLDDLFELRVRPNLATPTAAAVYRDRMATKGWKQRWPKLTIEDLPKAQTISPEKTVDLDRYPLFDPAKRASIIEVAKQSLAETGSAILPGFLLADALDTMSVAAGELFDVAHRRDRMLGAYDRQPKDWMDVDHPVRRTTPYRMHVIATDQFDPADPTLQLYEWDPLLELIQDILALPELHRLTDPLMRCNLTFLGDGDQHGWHFDGNDFVVSLLLQSGEHGGAFEFAPGIRTADDENYEAVRATMDGQPGRTRLLAIEPGTLVLFQGRHALHRVTEVHGDRPRIIALFSYDEREETNHGPDAHRRIFGRTVGESPVP